MGCDLRIAVVPRAGDDAAAKVDRAIMLIRAADRALTRFDAASELQRLNANEAETVDVSMLMALAIDHACRAAERTGGLLDPALAGKLVEAGYATDWDPARRAPLPTLLAAAPTRRPAQPASTAGWRAIHVDRDAHRLTRPAGLQLDLAATAKGLVADLALRLIGDADLAIVDLAGDLALGGDRFALAPQPGARRRPVRPWRRAPSAHAPGGVATSSIAGRCWMVGSMPAHHPARSVDRPPGLHRPRAGDGPPRPPPPRPRCSRTPSSPGPRRPPALLARHGGVLVHDDGTTSVFVGDHLREGDPDDRT